MHHKIVALDAWNVPIPEDLLHLPEPHTYELVRQTRQLSSTEAIQDAVRDATIIATTVTSIKGATLDIANTPRLRLIVAIAVGTDCIDTDLAAARGIKVVNCPNANTETVANHVLAMYFAGRRRLVRLHNVVLRTEEWPKNALTYALNDPKGNPPITCKEEIVGVVGYGAIGQFSSLFWTRSRDDLLNQNAIYVTGRRIAELCGSLGMKFLIAARKGAPASPDRAPFTQVLAQSSVLVLCVPRGPETLGLISAPELQAMPQHALLINVSRGGIVDEDALLEALRAGSIGGAASDVFQREPSGAGQFWKEGDSPLLKVDAAEADRLNLVVTPHVAWCSTTTFHNYLQAFKRHVENFCEQQRI
ncbi:hypothetical protein G3M48_006535 [Beauveria asiatica]|uniref:Glycerate dehydrogenase n=1 Tax=Beauveria asiatica TaxID=1069075 RepID=A0AAW0RP22_9HYPO